MERRPLNLCFQLLITLSPLPSVPMVLGFLPFLLTVSSCLSSDFCFIWGMHKFMWKHCAEEGGRGSAGGKLGANRPKGEDGRSFRAILVIC